MRSSRSVVFFSFSPPMAAITDAKSTESTHFECLSRKAKATWLRGSAYGEPFPASVHQYRFFGSMFPRSLKRCPNKSATPRSAPLYPTTTTREVSGRSIVRAWAISTPLSNSKRTVPFVVPPSSFTTATVLVRSLSCSSLQRSSTLFWPPTRSCTIVSTPATLSAFSNNGSKLVVRINGGWPSASKASTSCARLRWASVGPLSLHLSRKYV
mmetsp:Transcript_22471/g.58665  ORF Transcript_22471/g.58665 Transcript_22471/m.58665 type:complete len:211 (-) Transcript_22471:819-1451(-)